MVDLLEMVTVLGTAVPHTSRHMPVDHRQRSHPASRSTDDPAYHDLPVRNAESVTRQRRTSHGTGQPADAAATQAQRCRSTIGCAGSHARTQLNIVPGPVRHSSRTQQTRCPRHNPRGRHARMDLRTPRAAKRCSPSAINGHTNGIHSGTADVFNTSSVQHTETRLPPVAPQQHMPAYSRNPPSSSRAPPSNP